VDKKDKRMRSRADGQSPPSLPHYRSPSGLSPPRALPTHSGRGIRDLRQSVRFVRRGWGIDLLWNVMIVGVSPQAVGRPLSQVARTRRFPRLGDT